MKTVKEQTLKGKRIAITGILAFYKRKAAFELIREHGGIPQESVTKDTDYLVIGYYRKNTLKNEKSNKRLVAERYISKGRKIQIINEDEFLRMLWFSSLEATSAKCLQAVVSSITSLPLSQKHGG